MKFVLSGTEKRGYTTWWKFTPDPREAKPLVRAEHMVLLMSPAEFVGRGRPGEIPIEFDPENSKDAPPSDVPPGMVRVTLFRPSGKYYTEEAWRLPEGASGPYDMVKSSDFRQIEGGPVLVEDSKWGYPYLINGIL